MLKVSVIGGGSWATAIVKILSENLPSLTWWVRNEYTMKYIKNNNKNPNYLSYINLDTSKLDITTDINKAVQNSDYIIFVLPSIYIRGSLKGIKGNLEGKFIISAIKGIVPNLDSTISEFFVSQYGVDKENIAIIAGPTHSEDVAMGHISYISISGTNREKIEDISSCLSCDYIKINYFDDLKGIEYAMILKNIYAILSGIVNGLDYGDNFLAVLVSNCIREMRLFLNKVCSLEPDIVATQYVGDLLVTCYSSFSRNRVFGNMVGKGYDITAIKSEMNMIAEGYYAVDGIYKKAAENGLECKLIKAVYNIIIKSHCPKKEIEELAHKLN